VVTVNYVDDNVFNPTLGHEVVRILASLPWGIGDTEDFTLARL